MNSGKDLDETSSLLQKSASLGDIAGRPEWNKSSTEDMIVSSNRRMKFVSLLFLGFTTVIVMVGWNPSTKDDWKELQNSHESFDQRWHQWEAHLYKQKSSANSIPLLGSSRNSGGELIYFNHSRAFQMLASDDPASQDFYFYQQGWDAQVNQAYCAVASSMAAMNSLRGHLELPQDPTYKPFPWATQSALIDNACVRANVYDVDKMQHVFWGLGLQMATNLLNCHLEPQGFQATAYPMDPATHNMDDVRPVLIQALEEPETRLIINYDRGGITQGPLGHGHFSPIGAYHAETDSFLIMDVAKYKYPPVWAPMEKLWGGIATPDFCGFYTYPEHPFPVSYPNNDISSLIGCQSTFRGFILITKLDSSVDQ